VPAADRNVVLDEIVAIPVKLEVTVCVVSTMVKHAVQAIGNTFSDFALKTKRETKMGPSRIRG